MNVGNLFGVRYSGEFFVADGGEKVIGYAVFKYSFYQSGSIDMLYVPFSHKKYHQITDAEADVYRKATDD